MGYEDKIPVRVRKYTKKQGLFVSQFKGVGLWSSGSVALIPVADQHSAETGIYSGRIKTHARAASKE